VTAVAGGATGGVLLLVEDDTSIGRLVKQYLEGQDGWQVLWLRTGEEAVAELRRHPGRLRGRVRSSSVARRRFVSSMLRMASH